MRQPRIQGLAKRHHAGAPVGIKNVQVQRHAAFQIGQLEQAFHHDFRFEAPRFRLQHDADIFGRLITYIGKEGKLLCLQHVRHSFDQA